MSSTDIEYYFLFLIQGKEHATYKQLYNEIIEILQGHLSGWSRTNGGYQGWTRWSSDTIIIHGQRYKCEVSYYKKRLSIKFVGNWNIVQFSELFKIAKEQREQIEQSSVIQDFKEEFNARTYVEKIYLYPFIRIRRWITTKEIHKLANEEYSTTFFYDIFDPAEKVAIFFPRKALLRLSRPSVISTEISEFTKNKLMNAIYNSCLYEMRRSHSSSTLSDEIFEKMRDFIQDIVFSNQASTAQIEQSNYILVLSLIAGFSAFATIYSLMYMFLPLSLSVVGFIFFIVMISTIFLIIYFLREKR